MHEPPADVSDEQVLACVRAHWEPEVTDVEHLPVGFGAYHWAGACGGVRRFFVTLDALEPRRTREQLEGAYSGASDLAAQGLEFVLPPLLSAPGTFTVPLGDGVVSVTRWHRGTSGDGPYRDAADAAGSARRLSRLHAAQVGGQVPRWAPLVAPSLADDLALTVARAWDGGPYGESARAVVNDRLRDIGAWTLRYHRLAATTHDADWVPTHGEPHTRNLLRTARGDLVVDWESLKVAPRERDLSTLLEAGAGWRQHYAWPEDSSGPDPLMVELFDLEWRLDEIGQYAALFADEHPDGPDTRTALGGLRHELERPARPIPG